MPRSSSAFSKIAVEKTSDGQEGRPGRSRRDGSARPVRRALARAALGGRVRNPLLERAARDVEVDQAGPLVIADLGAAGGRNELAPLSTAIATLRARGVHAPIIVVHTDIPANDFSTLFETIERDPNTYLRHDDVFAYASGRSFYDRIFPDGAVTLGWTAIAVHWLSAVREPIPDHVYCAFARGTARESLARQSARDWNAFLSARAIELRPGAQLVVAGGAAADDGTSGAEALMNALNGALRNAVERGLVTPDEYDQMTLPTWNRTLAEFLAPFAPDGTATTHGLAIVEQCFVEVPDQYMAAYRVAGDADAFADAVSEFLRAFTEPSLLGTLERSPAARVKIGDAVYAHVRARLADDPESFETTWRVALLRISRQR